MEIRHLSFLRSLLCGYTFQRATRCTRSVIYISNSQISSEKKIYKYFPKKFLLRSKECCTKILGSNIAYSAYTILKFSQYNTHKAPSYITLRQHLTWYETLDISTHLITLIVPQHWKSSCRPVNAHHHWRNLQNAYPSMSKSMKIYSIISNFLHISSQCTIVHLSKTSYIHFPDSYRTLNYWDTYHSIFYLLCLLPSFPTTNPAYQVPHCQSGAIESFWCRRIT